jgi:hypothetical protein
MILMIDLLLLIQALAPSTLHLLQLTPHKQFIMIPVMQFTHNNTHNALKLSHMTEGQDLIMMTTETQNTNTNTISTV